MKVFASRECEEIAQQAERFIKSQSVDIQSAVSDMSLHIGMATDPEYKVPASARDCIYIGDGAHIGNLIASSRARASYKINKASVTLVPKWNSMTQKWDEVAKMVGTMDAAPDYLSMQAISPWGQGFFSDIFERPLLYSHASELVKKESGSNPWCEFMNLYLADYGGGAFIGGSGDGHDTKDVQVKSGFMTSPVINMFVTYSFTMEELEGAKALAANGSPYGTKLIQAKVKYADYTLRMLTDYLTYYGNDDTATQGLFSVADITSYEGSSLEAIQEDAEDESKGSTAYQALASVVNDFFSTNYNKFDHIKIGLSTYAFNLLSSMPYSNVYSPKSVLAIFNENYIAGKDEHGTIPRVEFYADPLLDAGTDFNTSESDYLVITAPEIGLGPTDTRKNVILQGMPLEQFIYPVVPGQIVTQHRMLRRYAGIYAPIEGSVAVYSGFGKKAAETTTDTTAQ